MAPPLHQQSSTRRLTSSLTSASRGRRPWWLGFGVPARGSQSGWVSRRGAANFRTQALSSGRRIWGVVLWPVDTKRGTPRPMDGTLLFAGRRAAACNEGSPPPPAAARRGLRRLKKEWPGADGLRGSALVNVSDSPHNLVWGGNLEEAVMRRTGSCVRLLVRRYGTFNRFCPAERRLVWRSVGF